MVDISTIRTGTIIEVKPNFEENETKDIFRGRIVEIWGNTKIAIDVTVFFEKAKELGLGHNCVGQYNSLGHWNITIRSDGRVIDAYDNYIKIINSPILKIEVKV